MKRMGVGGKANLAGALVLALGMPLSLAPVACGGDESSGGTDTDGTGSSGGPAPFPTTRDTNVDTFTTFPDDDDDDPFPDDDDDDPFPDDDDDEPDDDDDDDDDDTAGDTGGATAGDTVDPDPTGDPGDGSDSEGGDPTGDGPDGGDCCEVHEEPGCEVDEIEACVCEEDGFCCDDTWDAICTVLVVTQGCGNCPGIGGGGDCCEPNGSPGCEDDEVQACVCEMDVACCLDGWDRLCVDQVEGGECGTC